MPSPGLTLLRRRNSIAVWNLVRTYPKFWTPTFWQNLRLARQAQANGAMQKLRELAPLIGLLHRRSLRVVVEIGTARGGTFFAWCRLAEPDALVVSIDLPGGPFGGGYTSDDISRLRRYGRPHQKLHFLQADSHDLQTRAALSKVLGGRTIDFLMIDGDHTYDGVKRDFDLYAPLVRDGCPIAFHDILPHPEQQRCEVDQFWNEIKGSFRHTEFIDPHRDRLGQWGGIGVLYWDSGWIPMPGSRS